jgi:hypothetical protein
LVRFLLPPFFSTTSPDTSIFPSPSIVHQLSDTLLLSLKLIHTNTGEAKEKIEAELATSRIMGGIKQEERAVKLESLECDSKVKAEAEDEDVKPLIAQEEEDVKPSFKEEVKEEEEDVKPVIKRAVKEEEPPAPLAYGAVVDAEREDAPGSSISLLLPLLSSDIDGFLSPCRTGYHRRLTLCAVQSEV